MTTMPVYTNTNSSAAVPPTYANAESSNYKIKDYTFLGTNLQIMHSRLSGNNEEEALAMRSDMAKTIMEMYASNGSEITEAEALAMVDSQYKYMSGGASVVDTIKETTKSANSFWNYVPIVNLFIDDSSEEDLYKMMNGEKPDTKTAEGKFGKTVSSTAIGAAIGAPFFFPVGAIVGGAIGLISGLLD